jgi:hypothetical protein
LRVIGFAVLEVDGRVCILFLDNFIYSCRLPLVCITLLLLLGTTLIDPLDCSTLLLSLGTTLINRGLDGNCCTYFHTCLSLGLLSRLGQSEFLPLAFAYLFRRDSSM